MAEMNLWIREGHNLHVSVVSTGEDSSCVTFYITREGTDFYFSAVDKVSFFANTKDLINMIDNAIRAEMITK